MALQVGCTLLLQNKTKEKNNKTKQQQLQTKSKQNKEQQYQQQNTKKLNKTKPPPQQQNKTNKPTKTKQQLQKQQANYRTWRYSVAKLFLSTEQICDEKCCRNENVRSVKIILHFPVVNVCSNKMSRSLSNCASDRQSCRKAYELSMKIPETDGSLWDPTLS